MLKIMSTMSEYEERYPEVPIEVLRNRVVEQLKNHYAHDTFDVEEFERRIGLAQDAANRESLKSLIRDLPAIREADLSGEEREAGEYSLNHGKIRREDTMLAVLSGVERRGVWNPARYNKVLAFMGGVDIDFTRAKLPPGVTEIDIFCLMGGVEIVVPEGVNVEMEGIPFMGGFEDNVGHNGDEHSPTVRVRGFALMGGVEIKHPKRKKGKRRGHHRRRRHRYEDE